MNIADLHLVRTILETGSLSSAAVRLGQSQPTLSRRLLRLEDQLQTRLFHRSPRGLSATDLAHFIADQTVPLDRQLAAIRRHVELVTNLDRGRIRVGVGPIIAQLMMPDVLGRFIDTTGSAEISVVTEDDQSLLAMLDASDLDIVIGPFPIDYGEAGQYAGRPMIGDRIIAVARPQHPIFSARNPSLTDYPMAIPKTQGSLLQTGPTETLGAARVSIDNYELLKHMTAHHDLICGGPEAIFHNEIRQGHMQQIDIDLGLYWQSVMLVRHESLNTPIVAHFVHLCETVKDAFCQTS